MKLKLNFKLNKKLIRLLQMVIVFSVVAGIVFYFTSGLSKVDEVIIKGNITIDEKEILESTSLDQERMFFSVSENQVSNSIYNDFKFVTDVKLIRKFPNDLIIEITEVDVLGCYAFQNKKYSLYENGVSVEIPEYKYNLCLGIIISNVNNDFINIYVNDLIEELSQIKNDIYLQISEIIYIPNEYDKKRFMFYMKDGNKVITTKQDLAKKFNYYNTLKKEVEKYYGEDVTGTFDFELGMYFTPNNL